MGKAMLNFLIVGKQSSWESPLDIYVDLTRCRLYKAENVKDAYQVLDAFLPDCIMMDENVSGSDGFALCKNLKSSRRFKDIPMIIRLSGTKNKDILRALDSGADDFVFRDLDSRLVLVKLHIAARCYSYHKEVEKYRRAENLVQIMNTYNHEFNNPLTIALGNAEWLERNMEDTKMIPKVHKLKDALSRMLEIVRKIRELRDQAQTDHRDVDSVSGRRLKKIS